MANQKKMEDHELEYEWVFWFDKKAEKGATQQQFENNLSRVGSFKTIQVKKYLQITHICNSIYATTRSLLAR